MRPGESCTRLLIASRDIEQTENSQIFIERQPAITPGELREKLEILQEALEKNDSSCIREALHRVVPTFHEPEEVNCGQGAEIRIPQQVSFQIKIRIFKNRHAKCQRMAVFSGQISYTI